MFTASCAWAGVVAWNRPGFPYEANQDQSWNKEAAQTSCVTWLNVYVCGCSLRLGMDWSSFLPKAPWFATDQASTWTWDEDFWPADEGLVHLLYARNCRKSGQMKGVTQFLPHPDPQRRRLKRPQKLSSRTLEGLQRPCLSQRFCSCPWPGDCLTRKSKWL